MHSWDLYPKQKFTRTTLNCWLYALPFGFAYMYRLSTIFHAPFGPAAFDPDPRPCMLYAPPNLEARPPSSLMRSASLLPSSFMQHRMANPFMPW